MRRIIVSCLLLSAVLLKGTMVSAYPFLSAYDRIMVAVAQRDESALKDLISKGININATNASGQTALCATLERQDAKGYKMLFNQGATVHTPCIRRIPPQTLQSFYAQNPELGQYANGRILVPDAITPTASSSTSSVGGIPWPHLGEVALVGAAAGVVALIGSGGKGGTPPNPGYDPSLFKAVETGMSLDEFPYFLDDEKNFIGYWNEEAMTKDSPFVDSETETALAQYQKYSEDYVTNLSEKNPTWANASKVAWEYNGGSFTGGAPWSYYTREIKEIKTEESTEQVAVDTVYLVNPVPYLPIVNAASAWVRGYTGYVVDRSDVDNPKINEEKEKIKVAVVDTGLEVGDYAHNQLGANISATRLNFVYGPCSEKNFEKCWAFNETTGYAYLTSGKNPIITTTPETTIIDVRVWDENNKMKPRQLWNDYMGQFAKECPDTGGDNCLVSHEISGTVYVDYYPVGVAYDPDASETPKGVVEYSVSSSLWAEYKSKYGQDGYVYSEETPDPTPGLLTSLPVYDDDDKKIFDGLWVDEDHGTHVSGILAAIRDGKAISGVAPDAEIIPVRADFQMNQVMNRLKDVIDETQAKVVNLSLGNSVYISSSGEKNNDLWESIPNETKEGYEKAAQKGTVLVFAAGNENKTQPHEYTVAPLVGKTKEDTDLKTNYANSIYKNLLISVVAVEDVKKVDDKVTASIAVFERDKAGNVVAASNRCGSSSMYCLAAPGGSETALMGSTALGNSYALAEGTSQATPVISGSVALLMGAFPFLKPQEVVQILFETADYITPTENEIINYNADAEAAGDGTNAYEKNTVDGKYNAIYGHGLVNLDKATDPVGLPQISFSTTASSGLTVNASSTHVAMPTAMAHTLSALPKNIVVLDKYARPYAMPTSRFVNTEKRSDALKRSFQSFMVSDEKMVEATDQLSFGFTSAPSDSVGLPTGSMTLQMKPSKDMSLKMAYTQDSKSFGGTYAERIVQNPFMNMRQAWGTDMAYRVMGNWSLTGGFKYGQNGFIDSDILDKMDKKPMLSVMQTGVRYAPKKSLVFDMSFGQMNEEESLLGLRGAGAFETDGNKTKFVSFGTSIMPFEKWQLSASYTYGVTEANDTQTLMKFSCLTSDAFALAALYKPDETATYGFKVASPLRVRSGTVTFDLPTARDMYEDRLYRTQYTSDMKPDAREYDLSLFFMNQLNPDLAIAGETGVRLHPDHQKEAKPDYQTLFKLNYQY